MATHTHIIKQEEGQTEHAVQMRASDPGSPVTNQIWANTTQKQLKYFDGVQNQSLGSGGGGGALQWRPGVSNPSPVSDTEFNQNIQKFVQTDGQSLYTIVKVPTSYNAGTQIFMYLDFYSPSTSNNWQFSSIAGLIRKNTDAAGSTTNQRTSTPTATTNTSPANKLWQVQFDLTSSTGQINGVAVSAGDEIEVELKRSAADTDTADVRFRPDSTTVTFS